jgi:hypothetical protein
VDIIDTNASRTIFYQFFFGRMKYRQKFVDTSNVGYNKLTFDEAVFKQMIQSCKPEVNHIDKVTGMTPVELAIREKNMIMIEVRVKHQYSGVIQRY